MKEILIKSFSSYTEAEAAKNFLEKHGIHSVLQRGRTAAATEFTGFSGEADLFVLPSDIARVREILGEEEQ
jgi:hypothetical protein